MLLAGVAGAQERRHQILFGFVVETEEAEQRQIAMSIVVRIEESELLLPMRGIISGIEIDGHLPHLAAQTLLLPRNH